MEQYIEFVVGHWVLFALLGGLAVTLIYTESRKRGASVSLHEATRIMNQDDGVVVDLRTAKEFDDGHIANAINIPFSELSSRIKELNKHKESPLILVCKMGQHSSAANKTLTEYEFTDVKRLDGGMAEWTGANMPVVKSGGKSKSKNKSKS
ncbi:MAG: rhodanese-like domain-containing protein [Pseudomonadales bacterium]